MEAWQLDHSSIKSEFYDHLRLSGNDRLLVTAPFGSGKTTFLNEFFSERIEEYFVLKLFPVNYSVSQNEDVFELIKFDLLLQLMGKYREEISLQKEDFSTLLLSQVYISERLKLMPVINALLSLAGKVGKSAVELLKALSSTIDDFKKFQEEVKIDEKHELTNFLEQIEGKKGSSYEMDAISELIFDLVQRVKHRKVELEGKNTDSVLIIDDLDRLDPEHTFRLFNIFTAHFDDLESKNKFGFDKVIFVCDIENIWKLYRHKYGLDVDFKGYLDKFYSYRPFIFDNRNFLKQKIGVFLKSIQTNHSRSAEVFVLLTNSENKYDFYYVVRFVLISLIGASALSLRALVSNSRFEFDDYYFDTYKDRRASYDYPILLLFSLLKQFYVSLDIVKEKLVLLERLSADEAIQKSSDHESLNELYISNSVKSALLPFLLPKEIGYKRYYDKDDLKVGYSDILKCWLHFETSERMAGVSNIRFLKATIDSAPESGEKKISSYVMLRAAFVEGLKINAIR